MKNNSFSVVFLGTHQSVASRNILMPNPSIKWDARKLSNQVNKGVKNKDFLIENVLKMVKGYLYFTYLTGTKKNLAKKIRSFEMSFANS